MPLRRLVGALVLAAACGGGDAPAPPEMNPTEEPAQSVSQPTRPLQEWANQLLSPSIAERREALVALGIAGNDARIFVDGVALVIADPDEETGFLAAETMARLGVAAVPVLLHLMGSPDPRVRQRSAYALGEGRFHEGLGALHQAAATDPVPAVREMAVWAIVAADRPVTTANKLLAAVDGVDSKEPWKRAKAARRLGQMAPRNYLLLQAITRMLSDSVPAVRNAAMQAMAQAGPVGVSWLRDLLEDPDRALRWTAAMSLARRRFAL